MGGGGPALLQRGVDAAAHAATGADVAGGATGCDRIDATPERMRLRHLHHLTGHYRHSSAKAAYLQVIPVAVVTQLGFVGPGKVALKQVSALTRSLVTMPTVPTGAG